jgi:hypothetical protein
MSGVKLLASVGVSILLVSCGPAAGDKSMAAPPTVVCGTTLSSSPAGAVVEDAVGRHQTITETTVGDLLFIKVSDNCKHGARVTWTPASAATLVEQALAKDGQPVVVVLKPGPRPVHMTLTSTRNGSTIGYVTVALSG